MAFSTGNPYRFAKGKPGGPGRPKRETERKYLNTMVGAVSLEDWAAITQRAVADAKVGDAQARSWLSKYLLGDEPIVLADTLEELRGEIERLRAARNGKAKSVPRGAASASGIEGGGTNRGSTSGGDPRGPGEDLELGGDAAGLLANDIAPLFES
jgi:hypothetical protein